MHEMSLALNIVEIAAAAARGEGGGTIRLIELEIGALAGVLPEALEFCFEAAAQDSPAAGARLKINQRPAQGHCLACDLTSPVYDFASQCPRCGEYLLAISQGRELRITAVTIDDESN